MCLALAWKLWCSLFFKHYENFIWTRDKGKMWVELSNAPHFLVMHVGRNISCEDPCERAGPAIRAVWHCTMSNVPDWVVSPILVHGILRQITHGCYEDGMSDACEVPSREPASWLNFTDPSDHSTQVARTKCHRLGALKNKILFSNSSGAWMSTMKLLSVLVFSEGRNEAFVPGLSPWLASFSLCPHMVSALCMQAPGVP